MRKTVLVLASLALAMLLVSGAALAAQKIRCERGSTSEKPCKGTKRADVMRGTRFPDFIRSFGSNDNVYVFARNDYLDGGNGRDRLYGGSGSDQITGGARADKINGGDGDDYLRVGGGVIDGDRIEGGAGNDKLFGFVGNETLVGNGGADELHGGIRGVEHLYGGDGDDYIVANDFIRFGPLDITDFVSCGGGIDTVYAEPGVDVLDADCEEIIPELGGQ